MNITNTQSVGRIRNFYGGLLIGRYDSQFYWAIEDISVVRWEEIPESLFRELMAFAEGGK